MSTLLELLLELALGPLLEVVFGATGRASGARRHQLLPLALILIGGGFTGLIFSALFPATFVGGATLGFGIAAARLIAVLS